MAFSVNLLARLAVNSPFPHLSGIKGSKGLQELRCQFGRAPLRIIYVFNPVRQSALIIGGDKTGNPRFYERIIPMTEKISQTVSGQRGGEGGGAGSRSDAASARSAPGWVGRPCRDNYPISPSSRRTVRQIGAPPGRVPTSRLGVKIAARPSMDAP